MIFGLLLWFGLSLYDAYFTDELLREKPDSELNLFIKYLTKWLGPRKAAYSGIMGPAAILGLIGFFHPIFLAYIMGMRTMLCSFQLYRKYGTDRTGKDTSD